MRTLGIDSDVISLRDEGHVGPLLRAAMVPVAALGLPTARAIFTALPELLARARRRRVDLIHGWMYHGNVAASIVTGILGICCAWGIRQSLGPGNRDKWLTRRVIQLGAKLSKRTDLIVYNSDTAREQHEARGYSRLHGAVVPNGFDTTKLRPDPEVRASVRSELGIDTSSFVVAKVARYHAAKDYPTFLKAVRQVAAKFPDAVFPLIGEGIDSSNANLTQLLEELGLTARTRLLGRRPDVARLMTAFDVLCLTSSGMEGFPNVIGEAMSCGVPCIGTAVGDVAMVIGDAGEVVAPGDPDAVCAAICRLLSLTPVARREVGERARKRIVENFSIERVARQYAELLRVTSRRSE